MVTASDGDTSDAHSNQQLSSARDLHYFAKQTCENLKAVQQGPWWQNLLRQTLHCCKFGCCAQTNRDQNIT
jgi:hypothetical protein